MRARTLLAFLIALVAAASAAANPALPAHSVPSAILKLANTVVTASNTKDASALSKLYTNDAVVVDEIPPFEWRGPGAGTAWWRTVDAFTKTKCERITLVHVRISDFQGTATNAYLIAPMTINEMSGGQTFSEAGTLTYTFRNDSGTWLISSQVWTTSP